jgi:hypothetical protein
MIFDGILRFFRKIFGKEDRGKTMANPKSKKPKFDEIDVLVTKLTVPDPNWPQGYKFEMERGGTKTGKKLDFINNDHPGFIVIFNILEGDPAHPTGCQFLPDPDDALWVQESALPDPPCPSNAAYWGQFKAIDVVKNDGNKPNRGLIVSNRNDYEQMFAFTLRFEIPGCNEVVEFDPIGDNQNGNQ